MAESSARLVICRETWPIRGAFRIARGTKTKAEVIVVTVTEGDHAGRGECVPYRRYGETFESVSAQIESVRAAIESGAGRAALARALPGGAARNALDCALWDLEAKKVGSPVWKLADLGEPRPVVTSVTVTIDTPEEMAKAAAHLASHPVIKVKLDRERIVERVEAVRAAAPSAQLIVDANEAWTFDDLEMATPRLKALGVALIEQPLHAKQDEALAGMKRIVPLCADESAHSVEDLARLAPLYDFINIKLDKTGGLTAALTLADAADRTGLGIMIGCMVGTSLAMAPAALLAARARYVDLDGPLLLKKDRSPGLTYENGWLLPAPPGLWGYP